MQESGKNADEAALTDDDRKKLHDLLFLGRGIFKKKHYNKAYFMLEKHFNLSFKLGVFPEESFCLMFDIMEILRFYEECRSFVVWKVLKCENNLYNQEVHKETQKRINKCMTKSDVAFRLLQIRINHGEAKIKSWEEVKIVMENRMKDCSDELRLSTNAKWDMAHTESFGLTLLKISLRWINESMDYETGMVGVAIGLISLISFRSAPEFGEKGFGDELKKILKKNQKKKNKRIELMKLITKVLVLEHQVAHMKSRKDILQKKYVMCSKMYEKIIKQLTDYPKKDVHFKREFFCFLERKEEYKFDRKVGYTFAKVCACRFFDNVPNYEQILSRIYLHHAEVKIAISKDKTVCRMGNRFKDFLLEGLQVDPSNYTLNGLLSYFYDNRDNEYITFEKSFLYAKKSLDSSPVDWRPRAEIQLTKTSALVYCIMMKKFFSDPVLEEFGIEKTADFQKRIKEHNSQPPNKNGIIKFDFKEFTLKKCVKVVKRNWKTFERQCDRSGMKPDTTDWRILGIKNFLRQNTKVVKRIKEMKSKRSCEWCGATPEKYSVCSSCKVATYCSRKCQVNDWKKKHKKECDKRKHNTKYFATEIKI